MYWITFMILIFKTIDTAPAGNVDSLSFEKPDKYDIRMAENDRLVRKAFDERDAENETQGNLDAIKNNEKLDNQAETLKKHYGYTNMYPVTNKDLWRIIYEFIKKNLKDFLENNRLYFKIHIRYALCTFIIPLLPTEYFLIFPSFYASLIPPKFKQNEFVGKFLNTMETFLKRVRLRSKKELLPTFIFARKNSSMQDVEFILEIPDLIRNDPVKILRWLFEFELEDSKIALGDLPIEALPPEIQPPTLPN